jgi:O-antigen/teichoic acid export membrane protein
MAFTPLITRLYGPENFGVLGTFTAVVTVAMPIAALSYPLAIVLPKRDSDALGLARLSIIIAGVTSALFAIVLLAFNKPITTILSLQAISEFTILIPVMMFVSTCLSVVSQWLIRKKQFGPTAKVSIIHALILNLAKVSSGVVAPYATSLLTLATFGNALRAAMLFLVARQGRSPTNFPQENSSLRELARRHYDFALYRSPQILVNSLSQTLPILLLATYFGPASAGFYALGKSVLGMPAALIGRSVADVFYPRINEAALNQERCDKLIIKATVALAAVGIVPFGLVAAAGPWMFALVFGEEWRAAGDYARWLSLWFYFGFMNTPCVGAIPVLGLQRGFLGYEVLSILMRVAALAIGFRLYSSDTVAVALFSLAGIILNALLIVAVVAIAKVRFGSGDRVRS